MRPIPIVLVLLALSAPALAADESTFDVFLGYGTSSTSWDFPTTGTVGQHLELNGGETLSVRALLTVPMSPSFSVMLGYHRASVDRGWFDEYRRTFFAADQVGFAEVGFRVRL